MWWKTRSPMSQIISYLALANILSPSTGHIAQRVCLLIERDELRLLAAFRFCNFRIFAAKLRKSGANGTVIGYFANVPTRNRWKKINVWCIECEERRGGNGRRGARITKADITKTKTVLSFRRDGSFLLSYARNFPHF